MAGTATGITAVQLDTKLPGIDLHLLAAALPVASTARCALLDRMSAAEARYEASLSPTDRPQHGSVEIMRELVPRLIGPQGSTLCELEEQTGAVLIVADTGAVSIYAPTAQRYAHALAGVQEVEGRGAQPGEVYRVRVLRIVDFGAYVALPSGLPALLHISELSHGKVREVGEVVEEGQELDVVCKGRDAKGFVRLSRKDLLPLPPEVAAAAAAAQQQQQKQQEEQQQDQQLPKQKQQQQQHAEEREEWRVPRADTWRPSKS